MTIIRVIQVICIVGLIYCSFAVITVLGQMKEINEETASLLNIEQERRAMENEMREWISSQYEIDIKCKIEEVEKCFANVEFNLSEELQGYKWYYSSVVAEGLLLTKDGKIVLPEELAGEPLPYSKVELIGNKDFQINLDHKVKLDYKIMNSMEHLVAEDYLSEVNERTKKLIEQVEQSREERKKKLDRLIIEL